MSNPNPFLNRNAANDRSGCFLCGVDKLWAQLDDLVPTVLLARPCGFCYPFQILVTCICEGIANRVELFQNRIGQGHRVYSSTSSSGVHMTGGTNPAVRQIDSILPRNVALAMCVQFQFKR